jgi:hypothetical protein
MTRRITSTVVLLAATTLLTAASVPRATDPVPVTVHEWGTFTSIAGADGTALTWRPLYGPQDLPCFVDRIRMPFKGDLSGTVRMETPVLYFYSSRDTMVDVTVRFRKGFVTEWFPRAAVSPAIVLGNTVRDPNPESRITWKNVEITPGAPAALKTESTPSHYYAARETDAALLSVASQQEKFLFYRGVGQFQPPLVAKLVANRTIQIANPDREPIGDVILFENRGGSIGYRVARGAATEATLDAAVPAASLASLRQELERMLIAKGLYQKEASAMVETWRDSWFEEGTRLFYIPSSRAIDAILPLEINPAPAAVARVFVGRIELMTPRTLKDVKDAITRADGAALRKYGRFLAPAIAQIAADLTPVEQAAWDARLDAAYRSFYSAAPATVTCR